MDENFPEVLAYDLEMSKALFEARSMTAGTPTSIIASDCMAKSRAIAYPHRMGSPPSSCQSALTRVRSLEAIQERSSMASSFDQQEALSYADTASDLDSLTGTEASSTYDAEPPSFRMREQSIVTNATSLASTNWRPSSKSSSPSRIGSRDEGSWIEADSDGEEEEVRDYNVASQSSPQPRTPSEADLELDAGLNRSALQEDLDAFLHRSSIDGGAPLAAPQKQHVHVGNSSADTWRSPPRATKREEARKTNRSHPSFISQQAALVRSQQMPRFPHSNTVCGADDRARLEAPSKDHAADPSLASEGLPGLDDDFMDANERQGPWQRPWQRPNTVYSRPSPPPSPLPSVQTWLNRNRQPYSLAFQNDELARLMPLPPDVIETLRVSTACFPETMLLSSSLTIETIRSYSKKVRRPSIDVAPLSPPQSPGPPTRKSLWRRVVRRGSHFRGSAGGNFQSPSSSSLEALNPWASLRNVFGGCSDYICDALYAHIVAYNYISAIVARNPPRSMYGRSRTPIEPQHEDIPKKAASLLGISPASSMATGASARAAKGLSSSLPPWIKEEMMATSQPATSANHAAVRGIQAELLRCIRRLIATAKLMAESGAGEDKMVDMETEDTDMLFVRSLCETVRMSEENGHT